MSRPWRAICSLVSCSRSRTLIAVSVVAFVLTTAARGDPALLALQQGGYDPTPELLQQYRAMLGLDDPLPVRYLRWLMGVAHGDLGTSFISNRPVAEMLGERVLPTFVLGVVALLLSTTFGVGLGLLLALSRSDSVDLGTRVLVSFLAGIPSFWLAIGLILLFGAKLRLQEQHFRSAAESDLSAYLGGDGKGVNEAGQG